MPITHLHHAQAALQWLRTRAVVRLASDSRRVQPGDAFIAWPGFATDGRRYVQAALQAGAAACLVEADGVQAFGFDDARIAAVPGLKGLTGPLAAAFLGEPSAQMQVVAVTGTNGKTSSTFWIAQALAALHMPCAVVGTLGVGVPPRLVPTGLTTPDPVTLQYALRGFVDTGVRHCAMEASSIGLAEHRLAGTGIGVAAFTNFTRDHLDYHGNMQEYWAAKKALFNWPGLRHAVVNVDDEQGRALAEDLQARTGALQVWSCSSLRAARLAAEEVNLTAQGLSFRVVEGLARAQVSSRLVGRYNVDNLLGVVAVLRALQVPLAQACEVVSQLAPVPGRLQRLAAAARQPEVVVDYAHTPDALEKALEAVRALAQARGGELWCVFGCGGNRDATKRPLMGAIAAAGANHVVVTSDNPRDEDPQLILEHIRAGMPVDSGALLIENRREAIFHAVESARAGDVVLIAGKGHEDYQEIAGERHPFSDVSVGGEALRHRQEAPRA